MCDRENQCEIISVSLGKIEKAIPKTQMMWASGLQEEAIVNEVMVRVCKMMTTTMASFRIHILPEQKSLSWEKERP